MRFGWPILIAALFISAPALADVTATYGVSGGRVPDMIVRANEKGDSRITSGNQMAVLTVDDETYVILSDLNGVFAVRQADMIAAFADMLPPEFRDGTQPVEASSYEIVEAGTETVGGVEGIVLAVLREGEERGVTSRYVVSRDPALAPIGAALARQFAQSAEAMHSYLGGREIGAPLLEIFSRGTVIRLGNLLRLQSVDTDSIPPSEFALQHPVLTREEFVARMGWPRRD